MKTQFSALDFILPLDAIQSRTTFYAPVAVFVKHDDPRPSEVAISREQVRLFPHTNQFGEAEIAALKFYQLKTTINL